MLLEYEIGSKVSQPEFYEEEISDSWEVMSEAPFSWRSRGIFSQPPGSMLRSDEIAHRAPV